MDPGIEREIRAAVAPHLKRARRGDWGHTLRTVDYGKRLLDKEPGDAQVVIPALYLHDIGWSCVDFRDFLGAPPGEKARTKSARWHMRYSAVLADQILLRMGFSRDIRQRIVSIVSVHDLAERILAFDDKSAWMVFEADHLDRFGPESLGRYSEMMGTDIRKDWRRDNTVAFLKKGLASWFTSPTARAIAERLTTEFSW